MGRRALFSFFLMIIFSNKSFNYKMTYLVYSGNSNFKSEGKRKKYSLKDIYFLFSINANNFYFTEYFWNKTL